MASTPHSAASMTLGGHEEFDGLVLRDVDSVHDFVDPRLTLASRPSARELDSSFSRKLSDALHHNHSTIHDHGTGHVHDDDYLEKQQHGKQREDESAEKGEKDLEKGVDRTGVSTESEEILYVSWPHIWK